MIKEKPSASLSNVIGLAKGFFLFYDVLLFFKAFSEST